MDSDMENVEDFADDSDGHGYGCGDLDDCELLNSLSEQDRTSLFPIIQVAFPNSPQRTHLLLERNSVNTSIRPADINLTYLMRKHKKLLLGGLQEIEEGRSSSLLSPQEEKLSKLHAASASFMVMDGYNCRETNDDNVDSVEDTAESTSMCSNGPTRLLLSSSAKHLFSRQAMENLNSIAYAPAYNKMNTNAMNSTSNPPWMMMMNQRELGTSQDIQPPLCSHVSLQNPSARFGEKLHHNMHVETLSLVQNNVPSGDVCCSMSSAEKKKKNVAISASLWNLLRHHCAGDGDSELEDDVCFQLPSRPHEFQNGKFLKVGNSHEQIKASSSQVNEPIIQQKAVALQALQKPRQKVIYLEDYYVKHSEKSNVDSFQVSNSDLRKGRSASMQVPKPQWKPQGKFEVLRVRDDHEQINSAVLRDYNGNKQINSEVFGVYKDHEQINSEVLRVCNAHQQIESQVLRVCDAHEQINSEGFRACNDHEWMNSEILNVCNVGEQINSEVFRVCKDHEQINSEVLRVCNAHQQIESEILRVCDVYEQINSEVFRAFNDHEQINSEGLKGCNAHEQINSEVLRLFDVHEQKFSDIALQHIRKVQQKTIKLATQQFMINSNMVGSQNILSRNDYSNDFKQFESRTDVLIDPVLDQFANRSDSVSGSQFLFIPSSLDSNTLSVVEREQKISNFPKDGQELGNSMNNVESSSINALLKESLSNCVQIEGPLGNLPSPDSLQVNSSEISTKIPALTWLDGNVRQAITIDKGIMPACEAQLKQKELVSPSTVASTSLDRLRIDTVDKHRDESNDVAPILPHIGNYSSINKGGTKLGTSDPSSHNPHLEELGINWNGVDLWTGIQDPPKEGNIVPLISESVAPILFADENFLLSSIEYMGPSYSADCSLPSLKSISSDTSTSIGCQANECNPFDNKVFFDGHVSDIKGDNNVNLWNMEEFQSKARKDCPLDGMVCEQCYSKEHNSHPNKSLGLLSGTGTFKLNQYKYLDVNVDADATVKCKNNMLREWISHSSCTESMGKERKDVGGPLCKKNKGRKEVTNVNPERYSKVCSNVEEIIETCSTVSSAISYCKRNLDTLDIEVEIGKKRKRTSERSMNDLTMSGNGKCGNSLSEVLVSMLVESGHSGLTANEALKKLSELGNLGVLDSCKPQELQVEMSLRTIPNVRELQGCRFALIESMLEETLFESKGYMILKNEDSTPLHLTKGKKPKNYRAKGKFHSLAQKVLKLTEYTDKANVGGSADERQKAHSLNPAFLHRWQRHGKRAKTRERRVASTGDFRMAEFPVRQIHEKRRVSQLPDLGFVHESHSYKEEQSAADQSSIVLLSKCQTSKNDKSSINEASMTVGKGKKMRSTGIRELTSLVSSTIGIDGRCTMLNGKYVSDEKGRLTQQEDRHGGSNVLNMGRPISSVLEGEQLVMGKPQMQICLLENQKLKQISRHCCKTDGKKWRCHQDAEVGSKYCKRHMIKSKKALNP